MKLLDGALEEIRRWLIDIPIDPEEEERLGRRKREVDPVALDAIIGSYIRLGPSGLKKAWRFYKLYPELGVTPTQWTFEFLLEGCSMPSPPSSSPELERSPEYLKREFAMYLVAEMAQRRELALERSQRLDQGPVALQMPNLGIYENLVLICINLAERSVQKKFVDSPTPIPYPPLVAPRHSLRPPPPPPLPPPPQSPSLSSPYTHTPAPPEVSHAEDMDDNYMTEAQSLTDAFEYLHEMVNHAGYRPRQWLLRRLLRSCMRRDDERTGWVLAEMERWGYADDTHVSVTSGGGLAVGGGATLGGMKQEWDMVASFWRRVPVEGTEEAELLGVSVGKGNGKGRSFGPSWEKEKFGWVRCGRRSRREGGKWKG